MEMELRKVFRAEVRAAEVGGKKQLKGYAAKYGVRSHLIGQKFREVISRGAFDRVVSKRGDTVALINHDSNFPLGRTSTGTLRLRSDSVGLAYELDLGNQSYAQDLYQSVQRGDINGCSFAFLLNKGIDDSWDFDEDSMPLRTVSNFTELPDISFVTNPAYPETTIDPRGLQLLAAAEVRARSGVKPVTAEELRARLSALVKGPYNVRTKAEADRVCRSLAELEAAVPQGVVQQAKSFDMMDFLLA